MVPDLRAISVGAGIHAEERIVKLTKAQRKTLERARDLVRQHWSQASPLLITKCDLGEYDEFQLGQMRETTKALLGEYDALLDGHEAEPETA